MSRLFRYKNIRFWLMIGFAIAFVLFDFRAQSNIREAAENEARNSSEFNYKAYIRMEITDAESKTDLETYLKEFLAELCKEQNVTITIFDFFLSFDYKLPFSFMKSGNVCVSYNVPQYPLHKGSYPTKEQLATGNGYAVISYARKKDTYVKNGKEYLDFCGDSFEITGYFDNNILWVIESDVIFFAGSNTDGLWSSMARYLEDGCINLKIESDEEIACESNPEELKRLAEEISEGHFYIKYLDFQRKAAQYYFSGEHPNSRTLSDNQMHYISYVFLFVMIMLCFIVEFWMNMRKKEFTIMRKNGFLLFDIVGRIYKELFILAFIGALIGKCLRVCMEIRYAGYVDINGAVIYQNFVYIILFMVITVTLSAVFSVCKMLITCYIKKGSLGN